MSDIKNPLKKTHVGPVWWASWNLSAIFPEPKTLLRNISSSDPKTPTEICRDKDFKKKWIYLRTFEFTRNKIAFFTLSLYIVYEKGETVAVVDGCKMWVTCSAVGLGAIVLSAAGFEQVAVATVLSPVVIRTSWKVEYNYSIYCFTV